MKQSGRVAVAYGMALAASLFWAGNFIVGRAVAGDASPLALALLRWVSAFVLLLLFSLRGLRQDAPVIRANLPVFIAIAATGVAGYNSFLYLALETATASRAGLSQAAVPATVACMALLAFRRKPPIYVAIGIAISFLGAFMATAGTQSTREGFAASDAWLLLAVLSYSAYSLLLERSPRIHTFSLLTVTFGLGALLLVPFVAIRPDMLRFEWSQTTVLAVVYLAAFPSFISYFCYSRAVRSIGAERASHAVQATPVLSALLGFLILGETPDIWKLTGAICILAGIVIAANAGKGN